MYNTQSNFDILRMRKIKLKFNINLSQVTKRRIMTILFDLV